MHIHTKIDAVTLIKLRRIISRKFLLIYIYIYIYLDGITIDFNKNQIIIESNKQI